MFHRRNETKSGPALQLSNEQRLSLGLSTVQPHWEWMQLCVTGGSGNSGTRAWACFDGDYLRKTILVGPACYRELTWHELTTRDHVFLIPEAEEEPLRKLTTAALREQSPRDMYLSWDGDSLMVGRCSDQRVFYSSAVDSLHLKTLKDFLQWAEDWCRGTTEADRCRLAAFCQEQGEAEVLCRRGDFFRFPIGRRTYGYGRVLLSYRQLRKRGLHFWDVLWSFPVVVKVYHIVTEDPDVPLHSLRKLPAMPSQMIPDNRIWRGDYRVVGNLPVRSWEEDYPVLYGRSLSPKDAGKSVLMFQCGSICRRLEGASLLSGCGELQVADLHAELQVSRSLLEQCLAEKSNACVWEQRHRSRRMDLRDPRYLYRLRNVCAQFGLAETELRILRPEEGHEREG